MSAPHTAANRSGTADDRFPKWLTPDPPSEIKLVSASTFTSGGASSLHVKRDFGRTALVTRPFNSIDATSIVKRATGATSSTIRDDVID
jgi:hypothetical protein